MSARDSIAKLAQGAYVKTASGAPPRKKPDRNTLRLRAASSSSRYLLVYLTRTVSQLGVYVLSTSNDNSVSLTLR